MARPGLRAPVNVDVIIVGASIAGLSAAFTLARAGHRVRVFERSSGKGRPSSSIRIPPNLSTILSRWGADDELAKLKSFRVTSFQSMESDEDIGIVAWHEEIIKETGGAFYHMHYDSFIEVLYKLARSEGAVISYNQPVIDVGIDSEAPHLPYIVLESGERLETDLVVGADGDAGIVRDYVSQTDGGAVPMEICMYSTTISRKEIRGTPLDKWVGADSWPVWIGDGRALSACPVKNNAEYALHFCWPDNDQDTVGDASWTELVPSSDLNFGGCKSPIEGLSQIPRNYVRNRYAFRPPLDSWADDSGQIVLIGAAAHPEVPWMVQNNALAVEDAEVLGSLMAKLSSSAQIPLLTEALQELREARCTAVIESDRNNVVLLTLPPGQDRDGRDAVMRMSLDAMSDNPPELNDDELAAQWDHLGSVLGYNATDAANDWWSKWGSLSANHRDSMSSANPFRMEITSQVSQRVESKKSTSTLGSMRRI